jgi:hypothetical protein
MSVDILLGPAVVFVGLTVGIAIEEIRYHLMWKRDSKERREAAILMGKRQKAVLNLVIGHGEWSPYSGWVWDNDSVTNEICESLVRQGKLEKVETYSSGYGKFVPAARGN